MVEASGCGPECCGFKSRPTPQYLAVTGTGLSVLPWTEENAGSSPAS
jgi:hypothetical protein